MKNRWLPGIVSGLCIFGLVQTAAANPIDQSGFNASATVYDFSGASDGDTTLTSGILTVTNGFTITGYTLPGGMNSPTYGNNLNYYDNDPNNQDILRFDFSEAVSAVGASFMANYNDITLSIYDNGDNLLESYTIDWGTLPTDPVIENSTGDSSYPYVYPNGFIGIDYGTNSISYATIDAPVDFNTTLPAPYNNHPGGLFVDNITYQKAPLPTPEPATMLLFGTGLAGIIGLRRKNSKK